MRRLRLLPVLVLVIGWASAWGAASAPGGESLRLRALRNPLDWEARQGLVEASRAAGDHLAAYYHAAWLAWLGPRRYADVGMGYLRDRRARDRAAAGVHSHPAATVVAVLRSRGGLLDTCFNGAIAQQATRLRKEVAHALAQAEKERGSMGAADPVAWSACVWLGLTLDDLLALESAPASSRLRRQVLRKTASQAAAVAARVPDSPGAHRTLAIVRARIAELDNRTELWELAIAEAESAQSLDPDDRDLLAMLWGLNLHAGHWEEARCWRERLAEQSQAPCPAD
jgi:hypothetical protein